MCALTEFFFRNVADAAKKLFLHADPFFLHGLLSYFFDVRAALFLFFLGKCAFPKNLLLNSIALFFIKDALKLSIADFAVNK